MNRPVSGDFPGVDEGASPRILLAAITSVLLQALEDEDTAQYADEGLRADLRDLLARIEHDLRRFEGRARLRSVEGGAEG